MKTDYDFHTHTIYSHGKGTIMDNAVAAKDKDITAIAITDHGFSHPAFGMRRYKLDAMRRDCDEAEKATGVKVSLGIESNILGISGAIDVKKKDYEKLDMILAGVHRFVLYDTPRGWTTLLFCNMFDEYLKIKPSKRIIDYNTKVYCNAIKNNPVDILTHPGFRVFCDPVTVANCCADYGTYFEINTKKTHLSADEWRDVIDKTKVNFVIDSDAHRPERVGEVSLFDKLDEVVRFPRERIFNIGGKTPVFRFSEFKKRL